MQGQHNTNAACSLLACLRSNVADCLQLLLPWMLCLLTSLKQRSPSLAHFNHMSVVACKLHMGCITHFKCGKFCRNLHLCQYSASCIGTARSLRVYTLPVSFADCLMASTDQEAQVTLSVTACSVWQLTVLWSHDQLHSCCLSCTQATCSASSHVAGFCLRQLGR